MKYRIVHFLQKYFLNPQIKILFAIGIAPPGYALLETTGRKTGKPRRTPVGDGLVGNQFWIVAEHGMKVGYVRNIASDPRAPETAPWRTCSLAQRHGAFTGGR
jgi:hypothetical protein